MDNRKIVRRNFFFEETCPFYMCDGDGIMLYGVPGHEFEMPCLCKQPQKLAVDSDDETRQVKINK